MRPLKILTLMVLPFAIVLPCARADWATARALMILPPPNTVLTLNSTNSPTYLQFKKELGRLTPTAKLTLLKYLHDLQIRQPDLAQYPTCRRVGRVSVESPLLHLAANAPRV